ncbi:His Kinase A (phospho-acceptor) domain-containing protein [Pustulibacterium marinum]|uniref:histidine kinase n=1 Tax=Pustulibacterium marinum TaxID=1224947 RepID=A0A1I7IG41_9FLAO|nr:ATP-binding protein [Pustulibacterium marinum]SFU71882.1 His Kinase A (phospho-acceptor) domain-containing protein [Pustulibacterium marinum]
MKLQNQLSLFIFFWFIISCVFGQQGSTDSFPIILNRAYDFYDKGNYKKSVKEGRELLRVAYELNNLEYIGEAYYLLGLNDETIEEYGRAKEKYLKALSIAEKRNDSIFILDIYNGLGNIASLRDNDFEKSEEYYLKGLEIGKAINDPYKMSFIINICWDYLENEQTQKVLPYLSDLYAYSNENDLKELSIDEAKSFSNVNYILGRYLGEKSNFSKAHYYLNKSITTAKQSSNYEELSDAYLADSKVFEKQKKIDSAYLQLMNHNKFYKLFLDKNMLNKLQVEEVKFNIEEYERALELSQKEQQFSESIATNRSKLNRVYLIIAILLLILVFVVLHQNSRRKKLIENLNKKNKALKLAEKKAAIAAEAKSNFVSNISHELRTPLHGVIGITSLLLSEDEISPKNKKLLKSLKFSGDYLLGLINNVLLMSKIDRHKIKIMPRSIELKNVFNHIGRTASYSAEKKNVAISFQIEENVPKYLILDDSVLSEVLINLIDNAVKFSENGNVWIRAKVPKEANVDLKEKVFIRFEVEDNGRGIPAEQKESIFYKFSQISGNESIMEGTGLGLSIVQNLLLQMGSDIHLESEIGKGSLFYFDLLCGITKVKEQEKVVEKEEVIYNFDNKRILMVEDNEINKLVTQKFLSPFNIHLDLASEGNSGWEKIQKNTYDLILLDINIPYFNGYEIAQKTRAQNINTPIVAVTASELAEIEEQVYNSGMNDILIKPFNKSNLLEILSKYLN